MYALPGQDLSGAIRDVEEALALAPAHLSHYQLTLEPGTVFAARRPVLPDEDLSSAMRDECAGRLESAGLRRYEVSAWSRPGARCRHNLNYWSFGDYLGVGAGAHGKLTFPARRQIVRTTQVREPRRYLAAADAELPRRPIEERELPFEFMLNALRLPGGFARATFTSRTGLAWESVEGSIAAAIDRGRLVREANRFRPTPRGLEFLNEILLDFLPENREKSDASALSRATPERLSGTSEPLFTATLGATGE
jgi:coproporphyrinogen III oxidase-like Fe-S oxidoreductase